mmetsp:Transcript_9573/g.27395  ORF Transcript_9573/g.27395 Transcript_9573/m.27395 type:complete len:413 (-) Transcript_9573:397-1635(-)
MLWGLNHLVRAGTTSNRRPRAPPSHLESTSSPLRVRTSWDPVNTMFKATCHTALHTAWATESRHRMRRKTTRGLANTATSRMCPADRPSLSVAGSQSHRERRSSALASTLATKAQRADRRSRLASARWIQRQNLELGPGSTNSREDPQARQSPSAPPCARTLQTSASLTCRGQGLTAQRGAWSLEVQLSPWPQSCGEATTTTCLGQGPTPSSQMQQGQSTPSLGRLLLLLRTGTPLRSRVRGRTMWTPGCRTARPFHWRRGWPLYMKTPGTCQGRGSTGTPCMKGAQLTPLHPKQRTRSGHMPSGRRHTPPVRETMGPWEGTPPRELSSPWRRESRALLTRAALVRETTTACTQPRNHQRGPPTPLARSLRGSRAPGATVGVTGLPPPTRRHPPPAPKTTHLSRVMTAHQRA